MSKPKYSKVRKCVTDPKHKPNMLDLEKAALGHSVTQQPELVPAHIKPDIREIRVIVSPVLFLPILSFSLPF